jgi:hypothetical protein
MDIEKAAVMDFELWVERSVQELEINLAGQ